MKIAYQYIFIAVMAITTFACRKDNYDAPSVHLTGRVMYQGEALNLENGQVRYELYQYGWGKVGAISGYFTQDGSYAQVLFDGDYKFVIPEGQGPFLYKKNGQGKPDSLAVALHGNQTFDVEVTPYFMIRNAKFAFVGDTAITGNCKIEQIITGTDAKNVERVSLYLSKTQFASDGRNLDKKDYAAATITDPNNVQLKMNIPALVPAQNYIYARIGVKIAGVEHLIYSPVTKVDL